MGLRGWLKRHGMKRAAKAYARALPHLLAEGWGGSEFYSAGQVHAALAEAALLDAPHLSIAYAGNLPEDEYVAHAATLPDPLPYAFARALYRNGMPSQGWMNHVHQPGTMTPRGIGYSSD